MNEPTGWMSYLQFTKDDIVRGAELGVTRWPVHAGKERGGPRGPNSPPAAP